MFTVAGLFPLKPVMLLMPCHMLLGLLFVEMFFNFVFVLSFVPVHVIKTQSCSVASDWSDQHCIVLRAGISHFSLCL